MVGTGNWVGVTVGTGEGVSVGAGEGEGTIVAVDVGASVGAYVYVATGAEGARQPARNKRQETRDRQVRYLECPDLRLDLPILSSPCLFTAWPFIR
jgi:hypothetical protein